MHAEIADRKDEIARVCRRYRASRLEVFSAAARGTDFDPETSDVDFLVEFQPPLLPGISTRYFGLLDDLREICGRPVDFGQPNAIRNKYLKEAIDRSRELVYEA